MIDRHNDLTVIMDPCGSNFHEFLGYRPGIVVCHAGCRFYAHVVASFDLFAGREADSISLNDLLGDCLGVIDSQRTQEGVESRSIRSAFELRVERGLLSGASGGIGAEL